MSCPFSQWCCTTPLRLCCSSVRVICPLAAVGCWSCPQMTWRDRPTFLLGVCNCCWDAQLQSPVLESGDMTWTLLQSCSWWLRLLCSLHPYKKCRLIPDCHRPCPACFCRNFRSESTQRKCISMCHFLLQKNQEKIAHISVNRCAMESYSIVTNNKTAICSKWMEMEVIILSGRHFGKTTKCI